MKRLSLIAVLAIVSIAACSGGDDSADEGATPDPSPAPTTSLASTEPVSTTDAPDGDGSVADTSTTIAPATDDGAATDAATTTTVALIDGVEATIELLTPVAGSGIRPLLEWSPVDRASYYMAVVYAPDGTPYWTWTGSSTFVHVGGDPVLDDERPGPSVIDGMTWGIVALDDEIVPVAFSDRRPIGP